MTTCRCGGKTIKVPKKKVAAKKVPPKKVPPKTDIKKSALSKKLSIANTKKATAKAKGCKCTS